MNKPARTRRGISVLLVDDQVTIGEAIRRMLEAEASIRFHHCTDPAQALAAAAQVEPTVILQDLVMPGVDGLTLVRYFRANPATRDVPIVVLSTREEATVKADAFAAGANDYLVKLPDRLELVARVRYHSRGFLGILDANDAWESLVESQKQLEIRNRFIRETFGRYLSDEVVASLLETRGGLDLGGETRRVTVLMSDLRGFTPLCESLEPRQVMAILNNYLGAMTEVILRHEGTIDEFIGDAILAIFGAPNRRDDDARRAIACAVEMQLAMDAVNARNVEAGLPRVEMGIGLNTGDVVVGNIGSDRRAKYGVVGSQVNLTSRIESYTVGGQILASEATVREAGDGIRVDDQREVEPKGVKAPITIYDIGGLTKPHPMLLDRAAPALVVLREPIPVRFVLVKDKDASGESREGEIVSLSSKMGRIRSTHPAEPMQPMQPMQQVKLVIFGNEAWAKTMAPLSTEEPGFDVWFTSVPPDVRRALEERMANDPATPIL